MERKVKNKELELAKKDFIEHQETCPICNYMPESAEDEVTCEVANTIYDNYRMWKERLG